MELLNDRQEGVSVPSKFARYRARQVDKARRMHEALALIAEGHPEAQRLAREALGA